MSEEPPIDLPPIAPPDAIPDDTGEHLSDAPEIPEANGHDHPEISVEAWPHGGEIGEGILLCARSVLAATEENLPDAFRNMARHAIELSTKAGISIADVADLLQNAAEKSGLADHDQDAVQAMLAEAAAQIARPNGKQRDVPGAESRRRSRFLPVAIDGLTRTIPASTATPRERFKPIMLHEIEIGTAPAFLVDGMLPAGASFGVFFGPPKSLKSFIVLDLLACIATGQDFYGRKVLQGLTVYVTNEGREGVKRRACAMRRHHGLDGQQIPFAIILDMPNLGNGTADKDTIKAKIQRLVDEHCIPVRAVIFDTLRRAIPGKSESDQKDVSLAVANCEDISATFDCLAGFIHHSPRSDENRSSGTNSLDAAADVMWSVTRSEHGPATVKVLYLKDGEEGHEFSFELRPIDVGEDDSGEPIVSCYVEITSAPTPGSDSNSRPANLSGAQRRVFDILEKAIGEAGGTAAGTESVPPGVRCVTREMLKRYAITSGWWDTTDAKAEHSSRTRLNARLNEMVTKRRVGLTAEYVWIVR